MSSLHLMSMRADVMRDSAEVGEDPFGQAEQGAQEAVETATACEIWNSKEDIIVNERRIAAWAVWQGIMDLRSGVRNGDCLTNFEQPNGDAIFPVENLPAAQGGPQPFAVWVIRAVTVPGEHIGLTCEAIGGVQGG